MTTNSLSQITVPFHNNELIVVDFNNQPYTPMRPIVEGMGLAWQAQYDKLKQRFNSVIMEIMTTGKDGKSYNMICLPLKKLFGWLMTISPNKVKPELRDTVIMYQNECDDVLWDYWTKGQAVNPRSFAKTHKSDREPLTNAVNMLVAKTKHLSYSDAYKLVHQRFNVEHIDEIPFESIPVAVEYVHHLIALYSNAEKKYQSKSPNFESHANNTALHMMWVSRWWICYSDSIRLLNPKMAADIQSHFSDGAFSASLTLGVERTKEIDARIMQDYPYHLKQSELIKFFRGK